jgi:hypothetical protein
MNKTMKISHIVFIVFVAVLIVLLVLASKSPKEDFAVPFTEPVWTYWENKPGASTPEIVGRCYKNWKTIGLADNRIMLTEDNVGRFIPLSEMEKINKAADRNLNIYRRSPFKIRKRIRSKYWTTSNGKRIPPAKSWRSDSARI